MAMLLLLVVSWEKGLVRSWLLESVWGEMQPGDRQEPARNLVRLGFSDALGRLLMRPGP